MTAHVHFLAMEEKLPEWYGIMEEYFAQLGVALKLTNIEEIKELSCEKRPQIIVSESNLSSREQFRRHMKGYLGFALRNGLTSVHHISSFAKEWGELRNSRHYHFYRMPFSIAPFCLHLLQDFLQDGKRVWPGGKRAKLPIGPSNG